LTDLLSEGDDISSSGTLSSAIDVEKLISDFRSKSSPQDIQDKLWSISIDVQSLEDAKLENEKDSSLGRVEKAQILSLIDHASD